MRFAFPSRVWSSLSLLSFATSRANAFSVGHSSPGARLFAATSFLSTTTSLRASSSDTSSSAVSASAAAAAAAVATCLSSDTMTANPLLSDWSNQPFHLPPFDAIQTQHFEPALEEGMKQQLQDLQAIVDNKEEPSFHNVIVPYDRSGSLLGRVAGVYGNLCSSLNTDDLQKVQSKMSSVLSKHRSKTYMLPGLYEKVKAVLEQENGDLTTEQARLLERIHMDFQRAGAHFNKEQQEEYATLKAELATLSTQFQQNIMKDESTYELIVSEQDMQECPDSLVEAAKQAAVDRNKEDQYVITLGRSLVEPFLVYCPNRELRKEAWTAWTSRGQLDAERDNIAIGRKMLQLRQRQAALHGYSSFAEYQCVDRMAKTPEAVMKLLEDVWSRAKVSADGERKALEEYVQQHNLDLGSDGTIEPWDWRYVAEKVRKEKYDFDESLLKPYLSLKSVREAMFAVSNKLYGLEYVLRPDIQTYHPDVDVFEVKKNDELVAVFLHDNFARPFKSSGAWMSEFRSQTKNLAEGTDTMEGIPIVCNNNNLAKGSGTSLLSHDDSTTLFHEFGHGHHGMLSDATYSRLASTSVLTDFVELPSQLMEHWFRHRSVLEKYAKHSETGEAVPVNLLDKLEAAQSFNQGFDTIEYTACALIDMALHSQTDYDNFDLLEFEKSELARLGMPQGIVMRHRPAHFAHLFATEFYAAGYYVYLWAEVLDADAFGAFVEAGDIFDPETAEKARKFIYGAGNTVAPDELFRRFRGRDPDISFMLKKKGLLKGSEQSANI